VSETAKPAQRSTAKLDILSDALCALFFFREFFMASLLRFAAPLLIAATLVACATPNQAPVAVRQGRIEQITEVQVDHPHQLGIGAILGGAAGAGIGSLIGAGTGRDVAIAVGAIAGAVGGQFAQNKYESEKTAQQIVVRLNSGVLVVVTQQPNPNLRVGQAVYVEGTGTDATVVAR
jgi:outer membrane lipoprotein SlyB